MLAFAQWIQDTAFFTALRESWYVYPVVLSLHMVALALFGGLVLIADLRLVGVFRKYPVAETMHSLRRLKDVGLTLIVTCGLLIFGSKAEEYYYNPFFRMKMLLLFFIALHASAFHRSVYSRLEEFDKAGSVPRSAKFAGTLSLLLWIGVLICGRGIGYIDADFSKIHAFFNAAR